MLDMGNITDDKIEALLNFARSVAGLTLYGTELEYQEHHGDDAMEALNSCIEEARSITGIEAPVPAGGEYADTSTDEASPAQATKGE